MIDLANPTLTPPTVADLKQRLAALYDSLKQTERLVNGDVDPELLAVAHAVTVHLDAAQEAVRQANLARESGDTARAQRRLAVGWTKLQEAGAALSEYEVAHG